MSLIPIGTTIIQAALNSLLPLVFIRPRTIGGIIANVTLEERALDELQVTHHPVEQGASITDHAFKRPARIIISAGWSNSSFQALGNPNYVIQVYDALLALQASRQPFDVITGKRFYRNMLMERLFTTTDEKSENALVVICECIEIILVSTQTVVVPQASDMKNPQSNAAVTNVGNKNLTSAPNFNSAFAPLAL